MGDKPPSRDTNVLEVGSYGTLTLRRSVHGRLTFLRSVAEGGMAFMMSVAMGDQPS